MSANSWREFAKTVVLDAKECKKRWKNIVDRLKQWETKTR